MEWIVLEEVDEGAARLVALRPSTGERRLLYRSEHPFPLRPSVHPDGTRIALDAVSRNVLRGEYRARVGVVNLESGGIGWLKQSLDPKWRVGGAIFDDTGKRLAIEGAFGGAPLTEIYVLEVTFTGNSAKETIVAGAGNRQQLGTAAPQFLPGGRRLVYLHNTRPDGGWEVCLLDLDQSGDSAFSMEGRAPSVLSLTLTDKALALPDAGLTFSPERERVFFVGQNRGRTRQRLRWTPLDGGGVVDLGREHLRIEEIVAAPGTDLVAYAADGNIYLADAESCEVQILVRGEPTNSHRGLIFDPERGAVWFSTTDSDGACVRVVDLETREVSDVLPLGPGVAVVHALGLPDTKRTRALVQQLPDASSLLSSSASSAAEPGVDDDRPTAITRLGGGGRTDTTPNYRSNDLATSNDALAKRSARPTLEKANETEAAEPSSRDRTQVTPMPRPRALSAPPVVSTEWPAPSAGPRPGSTSSAMPSPMRSVGASRSPAPSRSAAAPTPALKTPSTPAPAPERGRFASVPEPAFADASSASLEVTDSMELEPRTGVHRLERTTDAVATEVLAPVASVPAATPSGVNAPAVNAPAVNAPAVNAPAVNAPAVNAPAVNAPAVNASAVNAPAKTRPPSVTPLGDPREDFVGWMKNLGTDGAPGDQLRTLTDAELIDDPRLRDAARMYLGLQVRKSSANGEGLSELVNAIGAAGYLRLHEAESALRQLCERCRERMQADDGLPEVEEHYAIAAVRAIRLGQRFDFDEIYEEYESMLAQSATVLENGGELAAVRVIASFGQMYLDLIVEALDRPATSQTTTDARRARERSAGNLSHASRSHGQTLTGVATPKAPARAPVLATEVPTLLDTPKTPVQGSPVVSVTTSVVSRTPVSAVEAAAAPRSARFEDDEDAEFHRLLARAEAAAVAPAPASALGSAQRTPAAAASLGPSARTPAAAPIDIARTPAAAPIDIARTPAAAPIDIARTPAAAPIDIARSGPAPRFDDDDEEAEFRRLRARAAASIRTPNLSPQRTPSRADFNPFGPINPTPFPVQATPLATWPAAPRPGANRWPVPSDSLDLDPMSSGVTGDISLATLPPAPWYGQIVGGAAGIGGFIEVLLGIKLGLVFLILGFLMLASGFGLLGDRRWGYLAAGPVFALNAIFLLVFAADRPPPWVPPMALLFGAAAAGLAFVVMLLPEIRVRYTSRRGRL